jgi:hypothetical protein
VQRIRHRGSGEHTRLACGVRRPRERHIAATRLTVLAEQGFPAGRRKLHAGTRALPTLHPRVSPFPSDSFRIGPSSYGDRRSVGRHRYREGLALVPSVLRRSQHHHFPPSRYFPNSRGLIVGRRYRPASSLVGGDTPNNRSVITGFQAQQRFGGGFSGESRPACDERCERDKSRSLEPHAQSSR